MKCDKKPVTREEPFEPESPHVIVCEGFQDAGLVCALLRHLHIDKCDVTFPKKRREEKEGEGGIAAMVKLLCRRDLEGIFVIRDADDKPEASFRLAAATFCGPFPTPKAAFVVEKGKKRAGVFLIPGNGKTGTLEHLLLEAVKVSHPEVIRCVDAFEACSTKTVDWSNNKKAKMRMNSVVAAFCKADPGCSLGFIWEKGEHNPLDVASPAFEELREFLAAIVAD